MTHKATITQHSLYADTTTVRGTIVHNSYGTWDSEVSHSNVVESILAQLNSNAESLYIPRR